MGRKKVAPSEPEANGDAEPLGDNIGGNARQAIKSFIDRCENLMADRDAITEDISEVIKEAKGSGFDVKILRKALAERRAMSKMTAEQWQNEQDMLDIYLEAAGDLR